MKQPTSNNIYMFILVFVIPTASDMTGEYISQNPRGFSKLL